MYAALGGVRPHGLEGKTQEMKLATVRTAGRTALAQLMGDSLHLYPFSDVGAWLKAGSPDLTGMSIGVLEESEANFAPVVPTPGKIVCVGLNYREHIEEMGRDVPQRPTLFAKFSDSLVGAFDPIILPLGSEAVDWEAELAVVMGLDVTRGTAEESAAAIAGFTVSNDISARDYQRFTPQWLQGKTFDSTTPLGPYLLTVDETGVHPEMELSCTVDGVTKQSSCTSDLVFDPVTLVQYISAITTLRAGDVILTGTPGGVGDGRSPKEYLGAGSIVETSLSAIGSCRNTCVAL